MTRPTLLFALSLALAGPALVARAAVRLTPPDPAEVANPEITAAEVRAHVRYLASDELAGRGSGTAGNDRAAEYVAERFRAAGVAAGGEGGTYFQSFPVFTGVRLGPTGELALRRGTKRQVLKAGEDWMPLSFSRNGLAQGPVVFAGYGISQPSLGYDDYQGLDVRGKVVLVLRHTPDGDDNGKFAPFARLSYKTLTAREKGAAGVLLVTGPLQEKEDLGVFQLESASADCGIPAAIVKRGAVEHLFDADKTLRDLQIMIAHGKTQSAPIPDSGARLRADVVRETATTRNVLGFVEGSDPRLKDEVIVIGAHYDHLGMGGAHSLSGTSTPEIHPGADDNASGTAGILELAQYFAGHRERLGRSLLFMAFSGEELGLLGSNYWTKHPTIPLKRVVAMLNLDMVGRSRNDSVDVIGTGTSPAWPTVLEAANAGPEKLTLRGAASANSGFGGSDQQSFYTSGVPVLFFFTGAHPDYHRPSDTWEKINAEGEAKLLKLVAGIAERTSRLATRPAFTRVQEAEKPSGGGFRVYLGTVPDYAATAEGVTLQGVREGSPAEKAGIRGGDVIVEFDGKQVRNVEEYTALLGGAKPNVPIKVVVLRGGQRVALTVTPLPRGQ